MTPDELLSSWADIIRELVGTKGLWRREQFTFEEWKALDQSWLTLKQQELRRLGKGKTDHE